MQVQNAYSSSVNQTTGVSLFDSVKPKNSEEQQSLLSSWGSDRVTISAAAREAAEAAKLEAELNAEADEKAEADRKAAKAALFNAGAAQSDVAATDAKQETASAAGAEFSDYMQKSTSKAQSQNPEERLKDLQDRLKSLEGQLTSMMSGSDAKPGQESKVEIINSQMNTIIKEIQELMSQIAEDAKSKSA